MNTFKHLFLLFLLPLWAFTLAHKYYVSVTQIDFMPEKQSVQITSRIFIDDLENLLRERYDKKITLAIKNEMPTTDRVIERYLKEKIKIKINGNSVNLNYIGKEYDTDIVKCYLEIEGIKTIETIEISNQVLFDMFDDQQNIIKTNINKRQKSFNLISQNSSNLLTFN
ncbi:MAG: peptidase E [Confluentibacter sp.]|nr:peptidase E [Confluentibacter sp.]HMQ43148.1 peptidase E [Mariniflexile sp.]HMR16500.1 peptidase E [Mariniflexile sp.]